ncbi:MAG: ParB/RepB/Spo0J family partition protein [Bacillota bacterium]
MEKINDVVFLDVKKIVKNPNQPRKNFNKENLEELAESIKSVGVIQPISVRKINNKYELIAGERRLRATKYAGIKKIPSVVIEVSNNQSAVLALVENIQRKDLNFIEKAMAYKTLVREHNISQKEIAKRVGKSQSTISNKLRILSHDSDILKLIKENNLTERHARALLKIKDKDLKIKVLNKIIKNELTVKQTDKLIKNILEDKKKSTLKKNTTYKMSNTIYVNTVKKAYDEIVETGIEADFDKKEFDDHIELKIKIFK